MSTPGQSSRVQLPAAGGGFFEVDISRAPDAIRDLQEALAELNDIRRDVRTLGQVSRTAQDPVSEDAARALEEAAFGNTGHSLLDAVNGGIREIETLIDDLQSAFQAYQDSDSDAASNLRSPHG